MASFRLLMLPGDGIGPEVMAELARIVDGFNTRGVASFEVEHGLVGGAAYDAHGESISAAAMARHYGPDAVIADLAAPLRRGSTAGTAPSNSPRANS